MYLTTSQVHWLLQGGATGVMAPVLAREDGTILSFSLTFKGVATKF